MVAKPTVPGRVVRPDGPKRPSPELDRRLVAIALAGLVLIVGGTAAIWIESRSPAIAAIPQPSAVAVSRPSAPAEDLAEMVRALQATQQETIDQLQAVQDQLAAQKLETKQLTDRIAGLGDKLGALQNAVSDAPASSSMSVVLPSKSHH